jgi:hypothetical protein
MFEKTAVDNRYGNLSKKLPQPLQIIVISPNHFRAGTKPFESIPKDMNVICFSQSCVRSESLAT